MKMEYNFHPSKFAPEILDQTNSKEGMLRLVLVIERKDSYYEA